VSGRARGGGFTHDKSPSLPDPPAPLQPSPTT